MSKSEYTSWVESDSEDNSAAQADRAAETGKSHFVTAVVGSFSAANPGALLRLIFDPGGGNERIEDIGYVQENMVVLFPKAPIEVPKGQAVRLELAGSGTGGQIGTVFMSGYTI